MTKKVLLLFLFLFTLFSTQALAHTGLKDSTPKDGEVITEPIQELTLNFQTKVEQTSKVIVSNSKGESVTLGNFVIEDNEMWATFLQPLENGDYKVDWEIIGADGHPIDGQFSFSVNVPGEENPVNKQEETEQEESEKTEDIQESTTTEPEQDVKVKQNNIPSYIIPSIMGVLFVIVVGSFLWLMRRKK
ncbi:copper resistance protein CopC [Peribacillus simplex]|uniref:copper resistance CopC family protein n=1 Tax=Peribacillus simplex TaxID=1478 RepID=UPI003670245F